MTFRFKVSIVVLEGADVFFPFFVSIKTAQSLTANCTPNMERLKITGVYVPYFIAKGSAVIMVQGQSFHFIEMEEFLIKNL